MKRLLFAILLLWIFACQAAVYSLPWGPRPQFVDSNGAPMSGGTLTFYVAGSTTPQNTYTDSTGAVANANPITLNVRGETPNEVWLLGGVGYKLVLKDSFGSTVWTTDNLRGINDTTVTIDQWVAGPTPTYVSATSFTLAGDQTPTFTPGRRVKTTNSGGTVYSTILSSAFASVTTITLANDSGTLDSGLSAVSYGLIAADNPSISPQMIYRKGASVASAGTTNIWATVGDYVHVTGTTSITSFGTAPYAGAFRTVVFDGALTLTYNATTLILPGAANITTAANDVALVRADTTANMVVVSYLKANGKAVVNVANTQPTRQVLISGTAATYTTPAGATRISVRMVGGGAGGDGGGSSGAGAGGGGTSSTFGALTAGAGGGASSGCDINITGNGGGTQYQGSNATFNGIGGAGGGSVFGGAGRGVGAGTGGSAATNSGGGGAGGGSNTAASVPAGAGGNAGSYCEKLIIAPAATYTYTVGAGGAGGGGGVNGSAGGAGAAGIIIIDESYN